MLEIRLRRSRYPSAVKMRIRCRGACGVLAGWWRLCLRGAGTLIQFNLKREGLPSGSTEKRILPSGGLVGSLPGILLGAEGVLSVCPLAHGWLTWFN